MCRLGLTRACARYTIQLTTGGAQYITVTMPSSSGSISPPNAASGLFWIQYRPTVSLSFSDGIAGGDTTSLPSVTVIATFSSAVSGVSLAAFNVIGGTPTELVALTPSM